MRETIANWFVRRAVGIAEALGTERVIEVSEHSIGISFEVPGKENRAWDGRLYESGQLYHSDYANPIKPKVESNADLDEPDTAYVKVSEEKEEDKEPFLITSNRYKSYMTQDLIDSLLTPREKWRLIAYAVIGTAFLVVTNLIVSLGNAGLF